MLKAYSAEHVQNLDSFGYPPEAIQIGHLVHRNRKLVGSGA